MPARRFAVAAVVLAVVLALSLVASGCGGGSGSAGAADMRGRLDRNPIQHLVPGASIPNRTQAPTSGAHQVGAWPTGALHDPFHDRVQVAMLEGGEVLVQYGPGRFVRSHAGKGA